VEAAAAESGGVKAGAQRAVTPPLQQSGSGGPITDGADAATKEGAEAETAAAPPQQSSRARAASRSRRHSQILCVTGTLFC